MFAVASQPASAADYKARPNHVPPVFSEDAMEGGAESVRADERLHIYQAETWRGVRWHA
jgi:hypothetical protein